MSKYTITHTCGHKHTYDICGPVRDRDRKADWLAGQPCPDCRRAAERKAATEAGEAAAARDNLPALSGSDKQVAWAVAIRGKAISAFERADLKDGVRDTLIACVCGHADARWWIDNRDRLDCVAGSNPLAAEIVARLRSIA